MSLLVLCRRLSKRGLFQDHLRLHGGHHWAVPLLTLCHQSCASIILSFSHPGTNCPCRDKSLNASGGSTQSVGGGDLSRMETSISPSPFTSKSVFRALAALDDILSAYLSFETSKFGKIVLAITFSLLYRFFLLLLALSFTFGASSWVNYG